MPPDLDRFDQLGSQDGVLPVEVRALLLVQEPAPQAKLEQTDVVQDGGEVDLPPGLLAEFQLPSDQ